MHHRQKSIAVINLTSILVWYNSLKKGVALKSSIIDSIKSLPPLSKTIVDINRVYADNEAGVGELAKVIEPDPMIVANLLKAANSPL